MGKAQPYKPVSVVDKTNESGIFICDLAWEKKLHHIYKYFKAGRNGFILFLCLRVDNNFNDINSQQEFRHLSNFNESSQSRDRSNSKKHFNENNDYHSPYEIHNFSDDDIPGDYTDNECELVNLN